MGLRNKVDDTPLRNEIVDEKLSLSDIESLLRLLSMAHFDNFKMKDVEWTYKLIAKLNRLRQQLLNKE